MSGPARIVTIDTNADEVIEFIAELLASERFERKRTSRDRANTILAAIRHYAETADPDSAA